MTWKAALALQTDVLGGLDLNPLAVLPDHLVVTVAAIGLALSMLAFNRAWLWPFLTSTKL